VTIRLLWNAKFVLLAEFPMRKMPRFGAVLIPAGACLAALALGGCYQASRPAAPAAAAGPHAPAPPDWPKLPENASCTNDLNRYQTIIWSDVTTGNLNLSVYDEIEADLSRAAESCANGNDSAARAIIRSTKIKHGYREYL
jgi:hypothetical protein